MTDREPPFQIKICGITTPDDAQLVWESEADAIGLNFYPNSPRFVSAIAAHAITEKLDYLEANSSAHHRRLLRIGVFVNATVQQMLAAVASTALDGIQFHGDESPELLNAVVHIRTRHQRPLIFLRAIRARSADTLAGESASACVQAVDAEIQQWCSVATDAVLLDAAVPQQYGGTGHRLDWTMVRRINSPLPLVLAGGLTPANVAEAISVSGCRSVDVASGVELSPGRKQAEKIQQFVNSARSALSLQNLP